MPSLSTYFSKYTNEKLIIDELSSILGLQIFDDRYVMDAACEKYSISRDKMEQAIYRKASVFNHFTFERERYTAYLKLALAEFLSRQDCIFNGYISFLIPPEITHVIKILVSDSKKYRIRQALVEKISEEEAKRIIIKSDLSVIDWVDFLYQSDAFSSSLHDIILAPYRILSFDGFELIKKIMNDESSQVTSVSEQAVKDMEIAAKIEIAMLENGHKVGINVNNNQVLLLVNPDSFNFIQLTNKLSLVAFSVEGVEDVQINKGEGCQFTIFRDKKFELPPKVLLVDDERDFVQTLSERLMVRNFGPYAVYDGQQALEFIKHEKPDVMVIDLRMPGMNGLEVLRQVKKTNPNIEVIILSGHGTLKSERASMELGAFSFLHKPADLEKLSKTIKAAYDKIASEKRCD
jgi:two-component system, OmpR family, response regulator CpxR